jgi:hypothetical protein
MVRVWYTVYCTSTSVIVHGADDVVEKPRLPAMILGTWDNPMVCLLGFYCQLIDTIIGDPQIHHIRENSKPEITLSIQGRSNHAS